jgi:2',3'-cyclic-nucleotide 2'-phosphodiesterase (5'-nucleotidase family)
MNTHVRRIVFVWLLILVMLAGCQQMPTATPVAIVPSATPTAAGAEVTATPTATIQPESPAQPGAPAQPKATATTPAEASADLREIIVLHTSDEHGYLLPEVENGFSEGGAAFVMGAWIERGHDPREEHVLLLSGGDNWIGPAISTWFDGESTVEVMNAMGYHASVIGNHEFDLGREMLYERLEQAEFPFLAANIYREGTTEPVDWAEPYVIVEVNDVKVGLVGLALQETPRVTAVQNLEGLTFGDYEEALRRWVPRMRQEGAEIIIAETHVCPQDLALLALKVEDLDIALFQGGHCHRSRVSTAGGALIASGTAHWEDYVWTRLVYDRASGEIVDSEQALEDVLYMEASLPEPAPEVQAIVNKWAERVDVVLGETIGYTKTGLAQHSDQMHNLLVNSWLWAYDGADVAISNVGGFRDGLPAGEITVEAIVGIFPFQNILYELELTGEEVRAVIAESGSGIVVGGLRQDAQGELLLSDGSPLVPDQTYRLLTTDYMYGNAKYPFADYDGEPYSTSIQWRQPVIDWIRAQRTTPQKPLETLLDEGPQP